jgi:cytochrome c553
MKLLLKIVRRTLSALVVLLLLFAVFVYVQSERRLRKKYDVRPVAVRIPSDSASVARGAHLYTSMISCALCHGADAGGKVYSDSPRIMTVAGPNLTSGQGGVGATLADSDWVRAIRHGLRQDGTSLIVMPSEVYVHLSNEDLGTIIAYLKQVAPVNRVVPPTKFGPVGRALLATGKMNVLVASKTPLFHNVPRVPPGPTAEYGNYIADASGCHGCHGFGLSGGRVAGPPGIPPASNLTVAGIGDWSEADFVRAMREGKRKNGTTIDAFMPWRSFSGMTDEELRALWLHLRSMPPRMYGNK